jgi:hypothetical protein
MRIVEDHRPLVDDLVSTGQELTDMCSAEEGQGVREDVEHITDKYDSVKRGIREKLHQLNGVLRGNTTDVSSPVLFYVFSHACTATVNSANACGLGVF